MRKLTSIEEIKAGMTIRYIDEEFEIDRTLTVSSVEPAPEYGRTSVMINDDYRVDVFENDVFEV